MKLTPPAPSGNPGRPPFSQTLPGILLIVASYALIHALTRLLSSGNLGDDDTYDNLLIQTLAPGYSADTGPLYDWALWLLQQFLGTGIQAFLLLKYSLLVCLAGLLFSLTRRLTGSHLWAFIAVESMASVYQIFWRFHEGFTHRVGAMVLTVATFWALLRLLDNPHWRNRLLLAGLIGLGLLSEHTYLLFLLALLGAAALQPGIRRQLFAPAMLAVLPLTLLIIAPYLQWLLAEPPRLLALVSDIYPLRPAHTLGSLWANLRDATTLPLLVLAPYIVIVPAVFPGLLKTIIQKTPLHPRPSSTQDFKQLLTHLLLIEEAELLIAGLFFVRSSYAVHSILPMFVIAIVWLTVKIQASTPSDRRVRVFMIILLAFTATAYAMRWGNLFVHEPFCSRCRWGVPYADLAGELRQRGFSSGILMTDDERMSGNLRRFFPQARLPMPGQSLPATKLPAGKLAVVWAIDGKDQTMPNGLRRLVPAAASTAVPEIFHLPWHHLWKKPGYRYSTWATVVVDLPPAAASPK